MCAHLFVLAVAKSPRIQLLGRFRLVKKMSKPVPAHLCPLKAKMRPATHASAECHRPNLNDSDSFPLTWTSASTPAPARLSTGLRLTGYSCNRPLKIYLLGFNEAVLFTWASSRSVENKEVVTNVSMITFYSKRLSFPPTRRKVMKTACRRQTAQVPLRRYPRSL